MLAPTPLPIATPITPDTERAALDAWWASLPPAPDADPDHVSPGVNALDWLCVARCRISHVYPERWLALPLRRWRERYGVRHTNAVLLYSLDYVAATITVHGLLVLRTRSSDPEVPARSQLVQRHWLRDQEVTCADLCRAPPLLYPTLESVHAKSRSALASCMLDPVQDAQMLVQSRDLMLELVRTNSLEQCSSALRRLMPLDELRSAAGQLRMAKMRFYTKLALLGVVPGEDNDAAARKAELALWTWTSALIALTCPTEQHTLDAVRRFHLPLEACPLGPCLADHSLINPLYVPMEPRSAVALQRLYAQSKSPHAPSLADTKARGITTLSSSGERVPLQADRPNRRLRRSDGASAAVLYDRALPTSFHCRLVAGAPEDTVERCRLLLRSLLYTLEHDALAVLDPATAALTCTTDVSGGVLFWGIQELVFDSGHRLEQFTRQWTARANIVLAEPAHGVPPHVEFVPHLQCAAYALPSLATLATPLRELLGAPHRGLRDQVRLDALRACNNGALPMATTALVRADGHAILQLGDWVADMTLQDLARTRHTVQLEHKGDARRYVQAVLGTAMAEVFTGTMAALGTPLLVKLRELVRPRDTTPLPAGTSSRDVAVDLRNSRQYREAEAAVGVSAAKMEAMMRALRGGERITYKPDALISGGKLYLNTGGRYKYGWRYFGGRKADGHELLSLVMFAHDSTDAPAALAWLQQWLAESATTATQSSADVSARSGDDASSDASGSARQPYQAPRTFDQHRDAVWEYLKRMSHVSEGTPAWRYLRQTRGLVDAPLELIEQSECLRFARSLKAPDGQFYPALVCATQCGGGMQRIFLDAATATKAAALRSPKLTFGTLTLAPHTKDAVCVQRVRESTLCVVCEGVETALSVACALGRTCSVFASLGVQFIDGFANARRMVDGVPELDAAARDVVWCRENDPPSDDPALTAQRKQIELDVQRGLARRFARVAEIHPRPEYKDFNDVHQRHPGQEGSRLIRQCFAPLSMWAKQPCVAALAETKDN